MARPIGTLGTISTFQCGGVVFADLVNLIALQASLLTPTGANSTARLGGATSGYQVTAGKTLKIMAVAVNIVAQDEIGLLYADNDVGTPAGTGFTNPMYWSGDSANQSFFFLQTQTSTQTQTYWERSLWFSVPSTKYVGLTSSTGGGKGVCSLYGYEV